MNQQHARVLFDFGGVITSSMDVGVFDSLLKELDLEDRRFFTAWAARRRDYDAGSLDALSYWELTLDACGIPEASRLARERLPELVEIDIAAWMHYRPAVRRLIEELHGRGLELGILSNMPRGVGARFVAAWPWLELIPHRLFSGEEGLAKPDPAIYELFLARSAWTPSGTLFIDDSADNVAKARALGFEAHHFVEEDEALAAIRAWVGEEVKV